MQLGRSLYNKAANDKDKPRKLAIYTTVAVLLIIGSLAPKGLLFNTLAGLAVG